jgi:hypothetical protein
VRQPAASAGRVDAPVFGRLEAMACTATGAALVVHILVDVPL